MGNSKTLIANPIRNFIRNRTMANSTNQSRTSVPNSQTHEKHTAQAPRAGKSFSWKSKLEICLLMSSHPVLPPFAVMQDLASFAIAHGTRCNLTAGKNFQLPMIRADGLEQ